MVQLDLVTQSGGEAKKRPSSSIRPRQPGLEVPEGCQDLGGGILGLLGHSPEQQGRVDVNVWPGLEPPQAELGHDAGGKVPPKAEQSGTLP